MIRLRLLRCGMLASELLAYRRSVRDGARTTSEWRMKGKSMQRIGHLIVATALCAMAVVGFAFIMEKLTARTEGFQNTFSKHAPVPAPPGR
jgi:hypothetical protein